jgi:hypothetical protein
LELKRPEPKLKPKQRPEPSQPGLMRVPPASSHVRRPRKRGGSDM